jgi:hypothetical protein
MGQHHHWITHVHACDDSPSSSSSSESPESLMAMHTQIRVSPYIVILSPTWDQFLTSKYSKFMDGIEQASVLYSRTNSQTPCWSSRSEPYWAGLQYSSHFDNIHQCREEPKDCHHIAVTSIAASILLHIWSEITPTSVGSSICVLYWRRMA